MYSDMIVFIAQCICLYCFLSLVVSYRELYFNHNYITEQNKKLRNQLKLSLDENRSLYKKFKFNTEVKAEKAHYKTRSASKSMSPKKER